MREWKLEGDSILNLLDVLRSQLDAQSFNVSLEVLHLAESNNGKDIGSLVHHVGESDTRKQRVLAFGDGFEGLADLGSGLFISLGSALLLLSLLLRLELTASQSSPGTETHAFFSAHGDDVGLKVSRGGRPASLIDTKLGETVVSGILIGFAMALSVISLLSTVISE